MYQACERKCPDPADLERRRQHVFGCEQLINNKTLKSVNVKVKKWNADVWRSFFIHIYT